MLKWFHCGWLTGYPEGFARHAYFSLIKVLPQSIIMATYIMVVLFQKTIDATLIYGGHYNIIHCHEIKKDMVGYLRILEISINASD